MTGHHHRGGTSETRLRIDKWLWHARFFKSRSVAAKLCAAGRVRVNRVIIRRAHHPLKAGDVLTFPQESHIRVVKVVMLGTRRRPVAEVGALYQDLSPPRTGA